MSRSESTRPSRTRANAWLVLVLPVAIALAACEGSEGPMGPEGPPGESGPGTRLVLSGVFGDNGVASQILPPEAGTLADPPAASCWISPDSQFWFTNGCLLVFDVSGSLVIGTVLREGVDPAGWVYRIVVVY